MTYSDRSPEYEHTIIGEIVKRGAEALREVRNAGLQPEHFTDEEAQNVFVIAEHLEASGAEINLVTVVKELKERFKIDGPGIVRLTEFGQLLPIPDLSPYVSEMVELGRRRRIIATAAQLQNSNGNFSDLLDELREQLGTWETGAARTSSPIAKRVREYIDGTEGCFTTAQLYTDLGAKETKEKTAIRQVLMRLKGTVIQQNGSQAGTWRKLENDCPEMDLSRVEDEEVSLWLPLDLQNYVTIHPGNEIIITGDPNAGKTAFLLRTIRQNLDRWQVHYFNSEMSATELKKRLDLFGDFPAQHKNFHAYERSDHFEDVVRPGRYVLNVIDYLEVTDEFYKIGAYLNAIHRKLQGAVALIAIQKRDKNSDSPLGAQRAMEKPRLAVALRAGQPNTAVIIKAKNRKTEYNLDGTTRQFKLIAGCKFQAMEPIWK